MKSDGPFSRLLACGVVVLAGLLLTTSAQAAAGRATVRAVRGGAEFMANTNAPAQPLKVGTVLREGAKVKTAANGEVDLFLGANGPVVRVKNDSELTLDKLTFERGDADETIFETQMDLRSGQMLGNVKKLASESRYEVKTASTVAGIRGTQYSMNADGGVTVVSGTVTVVYFTTTGQQATFEVNAGETFTPPADRSQMPAQNAVAPATQDALNAAITGIIQSTIQASPNQLNATITEIANAAAVRAASQVGGAQAANAAAQAAQAAVATAINAAQQLAATDTTLSRGTINSINREAAAQVDTQARAAATGAALVASAEAAAAAQAQGLSPGQVTQAAIAAATTASQTAAAQAGASTSQAANISNSTGAQVGTQVGGNANANPGQSAAAIVDTSTPAVVTPPSAGPVGPPPVVIVAPPTETPVSPVSGQAAASGEGTGTGTGTGE